MLGEKFTLDIRPTFVDELDRAAAYIELHLRNPEAADKLVADVYEAIDRTLAHPLVTAPKYRPPDVRQPYYTIQVRNYTVYYTVIPQGCDKLTGRPILRGPVFDFPVMCV